MTRSFAILFWTVIGSLVSSFALGVLTFFIFLFEFDPAVRHSGPLAIGAVVGLGAIGGFYFAWKGKLPGAKERKES